MRVSNKLPRVQRQVDLLEAAGFKIHMSHKPRLEGNLECGTRVRGVTTVAIEQADADVVTGSLGYGVSYCSKSDNFDRKVGTQVAFRRAVNDFYQVVGHVKATSVFHPVKQDESDV